MALVINSTDLNQSDPLKTVKPTPDLTDYNSIITGALSSVPELKKTVDEQNTDTTGKLSTLETLYKSLGTKTYDTQQAEQAAGVTTEKANYDKYSQDLNDINANISGLSKEAKAIPLQVQQGAANTGATDAGVAPIQTGLLRDNAIKALTQSALADITTANINNSVIRYNAAKEKAQKAVDLKYVPIENEIKTLKEQLEINQKYITDPAEKKLAAAQKTILDERARLLDEDKQREKDLSEIKLQLIANGKDPKIIDNAKSLGEAIDMAGSNLRTPNTEIVKLGDKQAYLIDKNTGKIIRSYGGGGGGTGTGSGGGVGSYGASGVVINGSTQSWDSLVNTVSNLESTVAGKKAVAEQMAAYVKAGDYKSAYNQVANSVASGLTGDTKTRFENARIDIEVMSGLKTAVQSYKDAGGDMGLLKGSAEEIERKLGKTKDPKLTAIAVQLQREFQAYRNAMTGAAFGAGESRDYSSVNPTASKKLDLNLAIIDGALNQLHNRVDGTIRAKVPQAAEVLNIISGNGTGKGLSKGKLSDRDFVAKVMQSDIGKKYGGYENIINEVTTNPKLKGTIPVVENATGEVWYLYPTEYQGNEGRYTKL